MNTPQGPKEPNRAKRFLDQGKGQKGQIPPLGGFVALGSGPAVSDGEKLMGCPVCGMQYVRFADAAVIIAGNSCYQARPNVRGNVICLPGQCEDGHQFTLCFGQHKGQTFMWTEIREGSPCA